MYRIHEAVMHYAEAIKAIMSEELGALEFHCRACMLFPEASTTQPHFGAAEAVLLGFAAHPVRHSSLLSLSCLATLIPPVHALMIGFRIQSP